MNISLIRLFNKVGDIVTLITGFYVHLSLKKIKIKLENKSGCGLTFNKTRQGLFTFVLLIHMLTYIVCFWFKKNPQQVFVTYLYILLVFY